MTFNQTPQSKIADLELNDRLPDVMSGDDLADATPDMQLARILDYQAQSLAKPDHLEACLGLTNGSLMKISCRVADLVNQGMEGLDMAKFAQLQPAIDTLLRVTRQVDRFAHLEVGCTESRRKAEAKKPQRQSSALRGFPADGALAKKSVTPSR